MASHPFARIKAKGWGTGLFGLGKGEKGWRVEVRGFPPFRQKKGERMGHGAFWFRKGEKACSAAFFAAGHDGGVEALAQAGGQVINLV